MKKIIIYGCPEYVEEDTFYTIVTNPVTILGEVEAVCDLTKHFCKCAFVMINKNIYRVNRYLLPALIYGEYEEI